MKIHKAEVGERYADDSGWRKRIMVDLQAREMEIDIEGSVLKCNPREIQWILRALSEIEHATTKHTLA